MTAPKFQADPEAADDSLHRPDVHALRDDLERAKSTSPALRRTARVQALKRALGKFNTDACTDRAASLTYYSVLSMFPALIALVSLLGVFGKGKSTVDGIMNMLSGHVPDDTLNQLRGPIDNLVNTHSAGLALVVGILGALWSASGYVGAFSRALNAIYDVHEGRPIYKLRPVLLGVTALLLVLIGAAAVMITVSGAVATTLFDHIGLGDGAQRAWAIGKWPALVVIIVIVIGMLYQLTPNVRVPKLRVLTLGGVVALVVMVAGVLAFSLYASNFGSYNKTYGALAGVIILLMLIWLANLALLLGAEVDAELERSRELTAGLPAEEYIQLPLRDTSGVRKRHAKAEKTMDQAADLRREAWAQLNGGSGSGK